MTAPVWLYWEGDRPAYIDACLETISRHATDVRLLDPAAFERLRSGDGEVGSLNLSRLQVSHRADVIRAFLLARFGGVWIDADCLVMRPLDPFVDWAMRWDFAGYREIQGLVSAGFMAARPGSPIMRAHLTRVVDVLHAGRPIAWVTLGAGALTETLRRADSPWLELECQMIEPVSWNDPGAFFARAEVADHERIFNRRSLCYMLANTMNREYVAAHPGADLMAEGTFFRYLRAKSLAVEICEVSPADRWLGRSCVWGDAGEGAFRCSADVCSEV